MVLRQCNRDIFTKQKVMTREFLWFVESSSFSFIQRELLVLSRYETTDQWQFLAVLRLSSLKRVGFSVCYDVNLTIEKCRFGMDFCCRPPLFLSSINLLILKLRPPRLKVFESRRLAGPALEATKTDFGSRSLLWRSDTPSTSPTSTSGKLVNGWLYRPRIWQGDISRHTSGSCAKILQLNNSDTRTGDILDDNRIMKPGELGKFMKTAKYRLLMTSLWIISLCDLDRLEKYVYVCLR
jgi:hypothetical protein